MIACNMGRALVLGVLPIAAVLGLLRMEALYAAAFLLGIGTTFFNVAFAAYLPHVVGRDHLVDGNSRLQASQSLAKTLGPALGGFLVHVFTAPIALLVDATSFVVSLIALASIRVRESSPEPSPQGRNLRRELAEGVQVVVRNSLLVPMIGASALFNVANMALAAVYVLYVTRELGVEPVVLGAIFAAGGPSAVMGAIIASHANRRIGSGVSLILGLLLLSLSQLCVFLAGGSPVLVIGLLVAARVLAGLGLSLNNVNLTVLVQSVTPSESLGRVAAILQFLLVGGLPVGSLIGGALGIAFGIRPTLLLATAWGFLSVVWLLTSPVRSLRSESLATATSHPGKTAH
jgi:MFS family permease